MDYYIFKQDIIFILSKLLKTVDSNQNGKRNLDNIMDP